MTNRLAYFNAELITPAKSLIVQTIRFILKYKTYAYGVSYRVTRGISKNDVIQRADYLDKNGITKGVS